MVGKKIFFTVKILTHIRVHAHTYVVRRLQLFYAFSCLQGNYVKTNDVATDLPSNFRQNSVSMRFSFSQIPPQYSIYYLLGIRYFVLFYLCCNTKKQATLALIQRLRNQDSDTLSQLPPYHRRAGDTFGSQCLNCQTTVRHCLLAPACSKLPERLHVLPSLIMSYPL